MSVGNTIPYSDPDHQPVVPPWAGVPWCTCGWKGQQFTGPILADHLREVGSEPVHALPNQESNDA